MRDYSYIKNMTKEKFNIEWNRVVNTQRLLGINSEASVTFNNNGDEYTVWEHHQDWEYWCMHCKTRCDEVIDIPEFIDSFSVKAFSGSCNVSLRVLGKPRIVSIDVRNVGRADIINPNGSILDINGASDSKYKIIDKENFNNKEWRLHKFNYLYGNIYLGGRDILCEKDARVSLHTQDMKSSSEVATLCDFLVKQYPNDRVIRDIAKAGSIELYLEDLSKEGAVWKLVNPIGIGSTEIKISKRLLNNENSVAYKVMVDIRNRASDSAGSYHWVVMQE